MKCISTDGHIRNTFFGRGRCAAFLCTFLFLITGSFAVRAQTVTLPSRSVTVDNDTYVETRSTGQSYLKNITSTNLSVASATEWGSNQVKIHGKRPGTATITFRDDNTGTRYQVTVTVNARPPKPPPAEGDGGNDGGGGSDAGGGSGSPAGYVRPIEVKSKKPEEPPIRTNTSTGYNLVYKNKYGEVVEIKQFDRKGNLVSTKEIEMAYLDGKPGAVTIQKPNGDFEEITYDINRNVITREVYSDIKNGVATKKEVLENGVMKKYELDANGDWKPVTVAAGAAPPQPKKPVVAEKQNDGTMRCLVGTWRSSDLKNEAGYKGGSGIQLIVKANGEATADYSQMVALEHLNPVTNEVETLTLWSGQGTASFRVDKENVVTIVRTGGPAITAIITQGGREIRSTLRGLGPIMFPPTTNFTCNETTLTLKPMQVETFKFERVR